MYIVWSYFAYLTISLGVTIWVARTLHKNGRIFLMDAFHGKTGLADSVNHLLVMGFCLVNVGLFAWVFATYAATNLGGMIYLLPYKLGTVLLTLGLMALVNLFLLSQMRNRGQAALEPPPLQPGPMFSSPAHP